MRDPRERLFGVDVEEVWRVVERDLPELKSKLKELIEGL